MGIIKILRVAPGVLDANVGNRRSALMAFAKSESDVRASLRETVRMGNCWRFLIIQHLKLS